MNVDKVYSDIKKILLECGNIIKEVSYFDLKINSKDGNNNLVTDYDIRIQNYLKKELLKIVPGSKFIGEESDNNSYELDGVVFIVDPIDGTSNFVRGFKMSAISVALLVDGVVKMGFCYNPYLNELYSAIKDKGAYLNGNVIHVSNKKLKDGIVLCGCSPYYDDLREKSLDIQKKFSMVASDFRRFGSAALEICNIACGRAEVYFELLLMPWDYAAGGLILEEAGGNISTIDGNSIRYNKYCSIIASNGVEDYLKYLN